MVTDADDADADNLQKHRLYEQLGAPILLYRNREMYTRQDEDPRLCNAAITEENAAALFHASESQLRRSCARWYYPVDHHIVCRPDASSALRVLCPDWTKTKDKLKSTDGKQQVENENEDSSSVEVVSDQRGTGEARGKDGTSPQAVEDLVEDDDEEKGAVAQQNLNKDDEKSGTTWQSRKRQRRGHDDNNVYSKEQSLHLQLEARAAMLLDDTDTSARYQARQKLRVYTQLDTNYVPASERTKKTGGGRLPPGLSSVACGQTQQFDRERLNRADPAYLAPFHLQSLTRAVAEDTLTRGVSDKTATQYVPGVAPDDPTNAPQLFGNCLCSFSCQCGVCKQQQQQQVVCLLHPVGPLQDRVRLSFLAFPRGRSIVKHDFPRRDIPEELNVGDRIRQIEQCGSSLTFVARTSLHCTMFTVTFVRPRRKEAFSDDDCWGTVNLKRLHRIDQRTLWHNSMPSYRPVDVACQPNYGVGGFTYPKLAVLYEASNGDRNIVHHFQFARSPTVQKHIIRNLQDISEIEFSSHHPMVLWAAARSYVRPALTSGYQNKKPRIGHGSSLYSIDLRLSNNVATFQWSPSAEEFVPEGIHSISGIYRSKDHSVFVSSISAGKTWEIDTRMPCRTVNAWSLPYYSDEAGAMLPATGLYGAGTLFSRPYYAGKHCNEMISAAPCPILSVGRSPGVFGLHLYQCPEYAPRFQTKSIEATAGPGLERFARISAATFALPDVSDKSFTCGLTTFRLPIQSFLKDADLLRLGYEKVDLSGTLCALTLTNNGDLYSHTLLESTSSRRRGKQFDGLPIGCSVIPAPTIANAPNSSWNVLHVALSNEFPASSQSLGPSKSKDDSAFGTIDLSNIMNDIGSEEDNGSQDISNVEETKQEANGANARSAVEIQGVPQCPAVATLSGRDKLTLSVPSHLATIKEGQSIEYFQRGQKSVVEESSGSNVNWRSDMTPEILKAAEKVNFSDDSD